MKSDDYLQELNRLCILIRGAHHSGFVPTPQLFTDLSKDVIQNRQVFSLPVVHWGIDRNWEMS